MKNEEQIKCFECDSTENIEHHHVVPQILGGTKTIPLCSSCHSKVHDRKETTISKLTRKALALKKANGFKTGGTVPYGFRLIKATGKLVKVKKEQEVISRLLHYREQGWTYEAIKQMLNSKNIPSKTGKKWCRNSVRRIIRRYQEMQKRK